MTKNITVKSCNDCVLCYPYSWDFICNLTKRLVLNPMDSSADEELPPPDCPLRTGKITITLGVKIL